MKNFITTALIFWIIKKIIWHIKIGLDIMNKEYIERLLKELNVMYGKYYVVGYSAIVIRDVREVVGDLDLCMTEKALEQ